MYQEEFVYDKIASPQEIMMVSRSLSYDEQNCCPYGYSYDNIGNRKTAQELAEELAYAANELNQYTRIEESGKTLFVLQYDASGNRR